VKEEFGSPQGPAERLKPRGIAWLWWLVGLLLLLGFACSFLRR